MDNQDSNDEIHSMSQRLQSSATIDNTSNSSSPQSVTRLTNYPQPGMESRNNVTTMQEGRRSLITPKPEIDEPVRNLPELNLPEKITLVIDVTKEENCTEFKLGNGATYMPMYMIKRVVEIFIGAKSLINKNHKFAIASLSSDSIKWLCDFTSNVKTVITALDSLVDEPIDEEESSFDLGHLFEALHANVLQKDADHVSRVVLIYSRSNCIPTFESTRMFFDFLSNNAYFVLDCLYVHEPPGDDNKCEDIYAELTALDVKNLSYILEVGRNATKLHDNMAKLLAHPLQRPLQRNACYTICVPRIAEEVQTNV